MNERKRDLLEKEDEEEKTEKLSVVLEIKGIAMVDLCNFAIKDVRYWPELNH